MGDSNETKAMQLMKKAEEKKSSGGGIFSMFGGGSSKKAEAVELYCKGANFFKMAKKWSAAGDAFCQAAAINNVLDNKHDSANNYVDAGTAFKKSDPQEAVKCFKKAVDILTDMGRFTMAAKHLSTIAEIYETDIPDIDKSMSHYEQAADYYKGEESNSQARKCMLKVALYAAKLERYEKAIEIYDMAAIESMNSTLLKYSAKEYFYKALLCHMCIDMLNAQQALQKYQDMFPAFSDQRECKLVKELLTAVEDEDADQFTQALNSYDKISRLDEWQTMLLLRVKKTIETEGQDLR